MPRCVYGVHYIQGWWRAQHRRRGPSTAFARLGDPRMAGRGCAYACVRGPPVAEAVFGVPAGEGSGKEGSVSVDQRGRSARWGGGAGRNTLWMWVSKVHAAGGDCQHGAACLRTLGQCSCCGITIEIDADQLINAADVWRSWHADASTHACMLKAWTRARTQVNAIMWGTCWAGEVSPADRPVAHGSRPGCRHTCCVHRGPLATSHRHQAPTMRRSAVAFLRQPNCGRQVQFAPRTSGLCGACTFVPLSRTTTWGVTRK